MRVLTINPFSEDPLEEYSSMTKPHVDEKVENARRAFESWRETTLKERTRRVRHMGKYLLARKDDYANNITEEVGKPIKESVAEVEKCAMLCEYFAHSAKKFLTEDEVKTEYSKSYVRYEPLGVVGSIMPWNFPMWQALRFAVPSILAGNVQVVKPSSYSVKSGGLALQQLFDRSKFPEHVFQCVIGPSFTGEALIESATNAISFTGSSETGSQVAQLAMKNFKKVVLEMGGNDPLIVLADANIDKAVEGAVTGRFLNCGQSCIASKRIIVVQDVAEKFTHKFVEAVKQLKIGDPTKPETDIGPMVREEQRKRVEDQVNASVAEGARILTGGKRREGRGFFFEPTVMADVNNEMTVAKQEVFGPVAPIIIAKTEEEAIGIANDTEYGLGASVWTENRERGEKITRRLNAGLVYVNKNVRSDPRLPFGGIKKSGIGRELHWHGILEMVNVKSIIIN
jgi:acyl-CoA reductase-like NAD-dependent aldehyde dehydrogenase